MAFYKDMAEDCKGIFEKHRSTGRVPEEKRKMKREEPKVDFSASSRTWAPAARDDIFDRKRWNV